LNQVTFCCIIDESLLGLLIARLCGDLTGGSLIMMYRGITLAVCTALIGLVVAVDPAPQVVKFNAGKTYGPDGPWQVSILSLAAPQHKAHDNVGNLCWDRHRYIWQYSF